MYSATFIFAKGEWDDEFHRLDGQIAAAARATPGYLGEECWGEGKLAVTSAA